MPYNREILCFNVRNLLSFFMGFTWVWHSRHLPVWVIMAVTLSGIFPTVLCRTDGVGKSMYWVISQNQFIWFFVPSFWQAHEWSVSPPFTAYGTIHSQALSEMPARIIRIFFLNASVFSETFWTASEHCQHCPFSKWSPPHDVSQTAIILSDYHTKIVFLSFLFHFLPKILRHRTMPFLSRLRRIPFQTDNLPPKL